MKIKKEILIILFLFTLILALPSILASSIQLSKDSYQPQETLQAQITGNFISLTSSEIKIYKQGAVHENPVLSGLTKQDDVYYFYALLPSQEGNYTLKIQDGQNILTQDFAIQHTNASYLSINPGFIETDKDFSINIKSLGGDSTITTTFQGDTENYSLIQDSEKTLYFSVSNSTDNTLTINDYNIPVFITTPRSNSSLITEFSDLVFIPYLLNATVVSGNNYLFKINLENLGDSNITNISLSSDINASFDTPIIPILDSKDSVQISTTIFIPNQNNFSGNLIADYDNNQVELPVSFEVTTNQSDVDLSGTSQTESLSCTQIGTICLDTQQCNGNITASLEGACCIGSCTDIPTTSYTTYIGILLAVILIGIIGYFYLKMKKKQVPKSTNEMLEEKSKRFKDRMNGNEVSGNLGNI